MKDDKLVNCPQCGGVGKYIISGKYHQPIRDVVCAYCKGTGRVKEAS